MLYNKLKAKVFSFIGGIARVYIYELNKIVNAKPLGIFKKTFTKILTGDDVFVILNNDCYQIVELLPRKNVLIRPQSANIDILVIVQSIVEPNLNTTLLNKYLSFYEFYIKEVFIVFTKTDLLNIEQKNNFLEIKNNYINSGYLTFDINLDQEFKKLISLFKNKTVCLAGNSGVGKSTFINKIDPNLLLKVQEISKSLNRGKHTTTNVSIVKFNDYLILDTPGFSSLELNFSQEQLAIAWHDFYNFSKQCKFSNCLHLTEPNCEIKNQLKNGKILKFRYIDYCNFQNELKNKK